MQVNTYFRNGCQLYLVHVEELAVGEEVHIEYCHVLQVFVDVFQEILGLPPERDINFTIDLVPRVAPASKAPH